MYADTELFYPYMHNFAQDFDQFEDYYKAQKPDASMTSAISEYSLEGEGDLFKALEPIIEEPIGGLDPMTASISLISSGEDVITSQGLAAADIESFDSFQNEQLLDVLYECEKDLMARASMEVPLAAVMDIEIPVVETDESQSQNQEYEVLCDALFQKSVSLGCLRSMECMQGAAIEPKFLDFPGMDFDSVYGMRRAFSEGDIKTLGNCNGNVIHSPVERPFVISSYCTEDRREKLSRYRNKKTKRNFGRKIKYACRKALADSQPRIHGRFAKTEESDNYKRHLLSTN